MGHCPATEVTHLGLNQPPFFSSDAIMHVFIITFLSLQTIHSAIAKLFTFVNMYIIVSKSFAIVSMQALPKPHLV